MDSIDIVKLILGFIPEQSHIHEIVCKKWREVMPVRDVYEATKLGDLWSMKKSDWNGVLPFTIGYLLARNKQGHMVWFAKDKCATEKFNLGLTVGNPSNEAICNRDPRVISKREESKRLIWFLRDTIGDPYTMIASMIRVCHMRGEVESSLLKEGIKSQHVVATAEIYPESAMFYYSKVTPEDKKQFFDSLLNAGVICPILAKQITEFVRSKSE